MEKTNTVTTIGEQSEKDRLFGGKDPERSSNRITFSKVLCIFSDALLAYCLFLTTLSIFKYFEAVEMVATQADMGYNAILPDLNYLAFLLPAAFVFAGLTHTFYYNKERFANCIRIRFEYIKELLMFKLNSGLYDKQELINEIDNAISQAEIEADALITSDISTAEQEQENIVV